LNIHTAGRTSRNLQEKVNQHQLITQYINDGDVATFR